MHRVTMGLEELKKTALESTSASSYGNSAAAIVHKTTRAPGFINDVARGIDECG